MQRLKASRTLASSFLMLLLIVHKAGAHSEQETDGPAVPWNAERVTTRADGGTRHPAELKVAITGKAWVVPTGNDDDSLVLCIPLNINDFWPGVDYVAAVHLWPASSSPCTLHGQREQLGSPNLKFVQDSAIMDGNTRFVTKRFTHSEVLHSYLNMSLPETPAGIARLGIVLLDAHPKLAIEDAILTKKTQQCVIPQPVREKLANGGGGLDASSSGRLNAAVDMEKMYEIWRQTGRNGAPPEPEVVILKPEENYTHSSLGEHMLFEVAVYDAPVNLDCSSTCSLTQNASSNVLVHMDPTDACWRVVVFIWDTSSSVHSYTQVWNNSFEENSLCNCTREHDELPGQEGGGDLQGMGHAGRLRCKFWATGLQAGRFAATAYLLDPFVNTRSQMSVRFRAMPSEPLDEPPPCWKKELPLEAQNSSCIWLWRRLHRDLSVYLSRHEIMATDNWGKVVGGSWGWLMSHFAGIPVNDSRLIESLPPKGRILYGTETGFRTCAVVGSAWHLEGSGFGSEIDQHDEVVRINDAPVHGYEEDVGSRTTKRVFGCRRSKSAYARDQTIIYRLSTWDDVSEFLEEWQRREGRAYILSPSFETHIKQSFFSGVAELTTGIVAVFWALHACSSVRTYGFGGGSIGTQGFQRVRYFRQVNNTDAGQVPGTVKGGKWETETDLEVYKASYWGLLDPKHDWDLEDTVHNRLEEAGAVQRRHALHRHGSRG